jgi:hypothetical protein
LGTVLYICLSKSFNVKQLHHIATLALAILMLFTATGFSVYAHSCAGELQDFAVFEQPDACPMKAQPVPSCHAVAQEADAGPCCENHSYVLERHDETVELSAVKVLKPELKLVALAYTFVLPLLQEATADNLVPDLYQQPPIARDIPVLVQSFLL